MTNSANDQARRLRFEIFRFNPEDADSKPHIDTFEIDERPYMTLYMALNEIRETQDSGLQFDFACRSAICGSCGMLVNGRPALGCRTLTAMDAGFQVSSKIAAVECQEPVGGCSLCGSAESGPRRSRDAGGPAAGPLCARAGDGGGPGGWGGGHRT